VANFPTVFEKLATHGQVRKFGSRAGLNVLAPSVCSRFQRSAVFGRHAIHVA
jgi:hypothetical protein